MGLRKNGCSMPSAGSQQHFLSELAKIPSVCHVLCIRISTTPRPAISTGTHRWWYSEPPEAQSHQLKRKKPFPTGSSVLAEEISARVHLRDVGVSVERATTGYVEFAHPRVDQRRMGIACPRHRKPPASIRQYSILERD